MAAASSVADHLSVKAEAGVDAAAGPLPPQQQEQEPTGMKRNSSFEDMQKLAAAPMKLYKLSKVAKNAKAKIEKRDKLLEEKDKQLEEKDMQLEEKEKELQGSKEKVTQLQQELKATRKHAEEVSQRAKEHAEQVCAELQRQHDAKVAQLTKKLEEHDAKVTQLTKKLEEEHPMEKEMDDATNKMARNLFAKLDAMFDASLP